MHEMSIVMNVFNTIERELEKSHPKQTPPVKTVRLVVGKFSNAIPDALLFAFDSAKENTIFENAELEIKETDLICRCRDCDKETVMKKHTFICPECDSKNMEILSGRELFIESIDI